MSQVVPEASSFGSDKPERGHYQGYYQCCDQVYNSREQSDIFDAHKKFYQADDRQEVYGSRKITGINNHKFNADYFYKLNQEVDDDTGDWRMSVPTAKVS